MAWGDTHCYTPMRSFRKVLRAGGDYKSAIVERQENWIMVQHGWPDTLARAVEAYTQMYPATTPQPCTVVISRAGRDFFALQFLDPIPTYSFLNLLGWLNQPPGIPQVSGAMGWYTSPATRTKYALFPDASNHWGDTLLGYNTDNVAVSVYQPDAAMCEISRRVPIRREPLMSQLGLREVNRVTAMFDADPFSANFDFVITHPKDTRWNAS